MKRIITTAFFLAMVTLANAQVVDTVKTYGIDEVVVTGARKATDVRHISQTVSIVTKQEIKESNKSSLLPVLQEQVPGIFITSRGVMGYGVSGGAAGNISMRGLSGSTSRLLVLIDGHPQYAGIYGHPIADAYQSNMADRVEVLRGPASLLYGSNAMGGVVNIVTSKAREDGVKTNIHLGYGSYNTLETSASNTIRKGRFSSYASLSYNRSDGHRDNFGFDQLSGQARLAYEMSDFWKVSADVNITHFNASQPGATTSPLLDADQKITRGVTSLFLENDYGKFSGALSVFYNFGHHHINDGYAPGAAPKEFRFVSDDDMMGVSAYETGELFQGNTTTVGVDFYRYGGTANNVFVSGEKAGQKVLQVDKRKYELAGYLSTRQILASWLTANAGLRIDRHFSIGTEFVPQAGLTFHLPNNIEIKASASKGFRYPIIREMYMYPPQNPDLKPESMWNYELAFSQKLLEGRLSYGLNVFHINAKNIIQTLPNPSGAGMLNQNTGKLRNTGVEAEVSYHINANWAANANYSYLYMKEPVVAAPKHKLYAGGSFTKDRWHFSTGLQYVHGLYTSLSPRAKENFVLWNVRGSYTINDYVQLWVNGENLTDTHYEINAGFPMPGATVMGGVNISF